MAEEKQSRHKVTKRIACLHYRGLLGVAVRNWIEPVSTKKDQDQQPVVGDFKTHWGVSRNAAEVQLKTSKAHIPIFTRYNEHLSKYTSTRQTFDGVWIGSFE